MAGPCDEVVTVGGRVELWDPADLPFSEEDDWLPVSSMNGPQNGLPYLARATAFRNAADYAHYVKRLEALEKIADSFPGVEKSYAIQAGREVRIMVEPKNVDDARALQLANDVARRVERELQYPGQIKVVVIRETRAMEYAR